MSSTWPDLLDDTRRKLLVAVSGGDAVTAAQLADPAEDLYCMRALGNLALRRHVEACNTHLVFAAQWFDHPHPTGRIHDGEPDFTALQLVHALYLGSLGLPLTPAARQAIIQFFTMYDFESRYPSENHALLFHTSRFLAARMLPDSTFAAYQQTGRELCAADGDWLLQFIRFRARRGWGEFDSCAYFGAVWECLAALHEQTADDAVYSPCAQCDAQLHRLSGMMMNLLLADMAVDSLGGMYCGAHGRIYPPQATDHARECTQFHQHFYLGGPWREEIASVGHTVIPLTCRFQVDALIKRIAAERCEPYENRERKHLHNLFDPLPQIPLDGSIQKLTYYTPHFVLGAVQQQDVYPQKSPAKSFSKDPGPSSPAWYAHHQQHQWDLSFATGPRARIFTHHPGDTGEHNHWTGDIGCGCGHFYQHRTILLAVYDIPACQPHGYIHAYVPRDAFDEVVEMDGAIFVRAGAAFGALHFSSPYHWTTAGEWKNVEVQLPGRRHGVVCEAALAVDWPSFAAFRAAFLQQRISFDADSRHLTVDSSRYGRLTLDAAGRARRNHETVTFDYATYDSPYMQSAWNSGVVRLSCGTQTQTLDFTS